MLVADASSAPVGSSATFRTVSADETDVEVVMSVSGATRALVLFCNTLGVKPSPFVTEVFVGKASVTTALTTVARRLPSAVTDQKSVTSSLHLPSRLRQSSMLDQRKPNKQYEIVDVGDAHKARLLLRRTAIGAQSVVKTMDLLVGNLTAAVVILGNHLQTAIQRLHISNFQIRSRCVGKAQAEVRLNSLNRQDPELTWVEPTYALADAASGEDDAGAPLDAKQLWKIEERLEIIFFNSVCYTL